MDDEAALIAARRHVRRRVVQRPQDVEAYRRLAAAVSEWKPYCAPTMERLPADDAELLDELADVAWPQPLAALLPDVTAPILRQARHLF